MFSSLGRGLAVIYTSLASEPVVADVEPVTLEAREPPRIAPGSERSRCEAMVHPEQLLADTSAPAAAVSQNHSQPDESLDPSDW